MPHETRRKPGKRENMPNVNYTQYESFEDIPLDTIEAAKAYDKSTVQGFIAQTARGTLTYVAPSYTYRHTASGWTVEFAGFKKQSIRDKGWSHLTVELLKVFEPDKYTRRQERNGKDAEARQERMRKARESGNLPKPGDVYCSSWGYDATFYDFFEVTRATEKSVWARSIAKRHVEDTGLLSWRVQPCPGEYTGDEKRHALKFYGDVPYFSGTHGYSAHKCDPTKLYDEDNYH